MCVQVALRSDSRSVREGPNQSRAERGQNRSETGALCEVLNSLGLMALYHDHSPPVMSLLFFKEAVTIKLALASSLALLSSCMFTYPQALPPCMMQDKTLRRGASPLFQNGPGLCRLAEIRLHHHRWVPISRWQHYFISSPSSSDPAADLMTGPVIAFSNVSFS